HLVLETSHRRVLTPDIVTDLGVRHRSAHPRVGNGPRVTAEVAGVLRQHCPRPGSPLHADRSTVPRAPAVLAARVPCTSDPALTAWPHTAHRRQGRTVRSRAPCPPGTPPRRHSR